MILKFVLFLIYVWINILFSQDIQIKIKTKSYFDAPVIGKVNLYQTTFLAKNQIVLFLYSESIFKMDEMTERVAKVEGTITTELFIPKPEKKRN